MAYLNETVTIENATIGFKNFAGKAGPYNREGDRNFAVFFEDREQAEELSKLGWNIKNLDKEDRDPHIQVKVKFGQYPPQIVMINKYPDGKQKVTYLDESTIDCLDSIKLDNVDLVFRPYNYDVRGVAGVAAYLQEMYVTESVSNLEAKYADVFETPAEEEECPF